MIDITDEMLDAAQASPRQREIVAAYHRHGTATAAAAELGIKSPANVTDALRMIRSRAARAGYAPGHFENGVAPGYRMGKVTVQRGADGSVERTWERQSPEAAAQRAVFEAAIAAMKEDLPRLAPVPAPSPAESKLCNLFTLTDSHVGALCWHQEGGDDWDLSIAEDTLSGAFAQMIASAPRARLAVINQLGDFLHTDGNKAVTPTSGHLLDADGRFRKMIGVAVRVLRRVVDMALSTHDEVRVILAEGNHDEVSSIWLQTMFAALYEHEPRVSVDQSALPYYAIRHGKTMLAFHHGHMKKNDSLPLYFASAFPEMWGATVKRYAHVGHRHHVEEKEHSGMKVIQHSTLAARDAYAARGGWMTERQALAITYHEEHGEVARATVTPGMLH